MEFIKKELDALETQRELTWESIKYSVNGENRALIEKKIEYLKKLEAKIITVEQLYQDSLKFKIMKEEKDNEATSKIVHGAFRKKLEELINCESKENGSDTPDYVLANFLNGALFLFDKTVREREKHYGRHIPDNYDDGC